MEIKATHRNARMAPRKIRQYRGLLRGLPAQAAVAQLRFMSGQAPAILRDVLMSAIANAQHNFEIPVDQLKVADIIIDGGFVLKRFRPVSKGMAHPILKRTSHVTVVIADTKGDSSTKKTKTKTQIEEITINDMAAQSVGEAKTSSTDVTPQDESKPTGAAVHKSKQEEARGKMNIIQQGGNPKKTHRRKSIG